MHSKCGVKKNFEEGDQILITLPMIAVTDGRTAGRSRMECRVGEMQRMPSGGPISTKLLREMCSLGRKLRPRGRREPFIPATSAVLLRWKLSGHLSRVQVKSFSKCSARHEPPRQLPHPESGGFFFLLPFLSGQRKLFWNLKNILHTCQAGGTSLWWRHLLKQTSKSFLVYMICSLTGSGSILTTKVIGFSFLCALKQRWQRLRSESSVANISLNKRHKNQNNNLSQPSTQGHAFKKTKREQINLSLVVLRTESLCVHKFSKHINKHMYEYIVTLNDQDDSKPRAYWRRDGLHHIESVSVKTFSPIPPSSEGRPGLLSGSLSLMRRTTLRRSLADCPPLHREQRDLGARGSLPRRGKLRSPW